MLSGACTNVLHLYLGTHVEEQRSCVCVRAVQELDREAE
jgi:hypothetical protein